MAKHIKYIVALSIILLLVTPVCSAFTFRLGNIAVNIGEPDTTPIPTPAPQETPEISQSVQSTQEQAEVSAMFDSMNTPENRAYLEGKMEEYNVGSILYTVSDQNIEDNYFYVKDRGFVVYSGQEPDVHIKGSPEQAKDMLSMVEDHRITLWERIKITSMISSMETQGLPKLSIFGSW